MSLFLKIFLWFWLSTALVVGVVFFINWSTQPENLGRQWKIIVNDVVNSNAQTAAQIFRNEGKAGLEEYLVRLANSERIQGVGLIDLSGSQFAGKALERDTGKLFERALASDTTEIDVTPNETAAAKKIRLADDSEAVFVTLWKRPTIPSYPDLRTRILQIVGTIFTTGLGCYALAWYLSLPIAKLRRATQKIAAGELKTRVMPEIGKRRDEMANLAKDFDEMAERIETLLISQKRLMQDISHELRSPLARLNVALELTKQKSESSPLLDRIETESKRLNEMISRLLLVSKLESGADDFEKQKLSLDKLIGQAAADANFEAQANNKSVNVLRSDRVNVVGNENLIRSAIENVLRNAVRYTQTGTAVEVSLVRNSTHAHITIKDHGGGVPEKELKNLFRPFYRIGEARERKTGGIGLGLAIAERAVHAHKGIIKAENIQNGLKVEISLPVAD